jgi:hypothetical protein
MQKGRNIKMFWKEKREHPSFSDKAIWKIVKDHLRKGKR